MPTNGRRAKWFFLCLMFINCTIVESNNVAAESNLTRDQYFMYVRTPKQLTQEFTRRK